MSLPPSLTPSRSLSPSLSTLSATLASALALGGCNGSGGGGSSSSPVSPAETLEASAPVAVSTVSALLQLPPDASGVLDEGLRVPGRSAFRNARLPALEMEATLRGESRALSLNLQCGEGGRVAASCDAGEKESRVRASFSGCAFEISSVGAAELDGVFAATIADPSYCSTGETDPMTAIEARFSDFTAVIEGDDGSTRRLRLDLLQSARPAGAGCAIDGEELTDGVLLLDGKVTIESDDPPIDLVIRADDLSYELVSGGDPCEATLTVNGRTRVEDRIRDRRYDQAYDDLVLTLAEDAAGGGCVTIDGAVENACLGGRIVFRTIDPICFNEDAECPRSGVLEVTPPGGATPGRILFTPAGGVEIDVEGDGTVDRTLASCRDADRNLCSR